MEAIRSGSTAGSARRTQRQSALLLLVLLSTVGWHISGLLIRPLVVNNVYAGHRTTYFTAVPPNVSSTLGPLPAVATPSNHPIDALIERAEKDFESMLVKQTTDLASSAAAYRNRRGRNPPPGFDVWYNFARDEQAVIVEEFWDQIYHDLGPFWGLAPSQIRTDARKCDMVVKVEEGGASTNTGWFWHRIWAEMIDTIAPGLPDMVICLNSMDEPRIVVPWEQISAYIDAEQKSRKLIPPEQSSSSYRGWQEDGAEDGVSATAVEWLSSTPYSLARLACPRTSAIRESHGVHTAAQLLHQAYNNRSKHDQAFLGFAALHSHAGFVVNYSLSSDLCHQPDLGSLHGALIEPLTSSSSQQLVPIFGGSKLTVNNDILLPAPMYWTNDEKFTSSTDGAGSWDEKVNAAVWRGTASGGHNTATNWHQFHRHRFVAMTNGTKYQLASQYTDQIFTPWLRLNSIDKLQSPIRQHLADMLKHAHDVAFTDLMCDAPEQNGTCWYTSSDFKVTEGLSLLQQFGFKYIPDIDGNSFSGRYRSFLLSTSLPIKATLFREWHDSRLVAWKHFVPMDNRFHDYYAIMEYFRGFEGVMDGSSDGSGTIKGHDAAAAKIATAGSEWARKVLRKEDMQIYVMRLLLEYARVTDDGRDLLGYVDDLQRSQDEMVPH